MQEVLELLLEPPEEDSILSATKRLQDLGALDEKDVRSVWWYFIWIVKAIDLMET